MNSLRKKGNIKTILILLFVLSLIYFSYTTFQEEPIKLDITDMMDSMLVDLSSKGTFVWNLYDLVEDEYEAYITDDEDYSEVPGVGYLHSHLNVTQLETTTKKTTNLLETRITFVNATIKYHNLSTDINYQTQIQFTIANISTTLNDIELLPPFSDEFDLSIYVMRLGEQLPIVKGSELQPNDQVHIHIQSIQNQDYQQDGTITFQLEIIEYPNHFG